MTDSDAFRVTGRGVLAGFIVFFAAMFVANGILIAYAVKTLPGVEQSGNAYQLGVAFNRELAAATVQDQRHWAVTIAGATDTGGATRADVVLAGTDLPDNLDLTVVFEHPANADLDRRLEVSRLGNGHWLVEGRVPEGLWTVRIQIGRNGERLYRAIERVTVRPGGRLA